MKTAVPRLNSFRCKFVADHILSSMHEVRYQTLSSDAEHLCIRTIKFSFWNDSLLKPPKIPVLNPAFRYHFFPLIVQTIITTPYDSQAYQGKNPFHDGKCTLIRLQFDHQPGNQAHSHNCTSNVCSVCEPPLIYLRSSD